MTPPPTSMDGTDITGATIDGQEVQEITVDGQTVFTAGLVIPDSGVSRWTFDNADTSGSTATDVWGDNDATINGAVTGVGGANQTYTTNEAYSFDGTDDNVDTEASFADQLGNVDASLAMWVIQDSPARNEYFWYGDGSDWFRLRINSNDGTTLEVQTAGNRSNDPDYGPLTSWTHVVCVYDESTGILELYRNGSLVETFTGHSLPTSGGDTTQIGQGDEVFSGGHWNGDIDDVRVYSKALTSTEVSNLYNNGSI